MSASHEANPDSRPLPDGWITEYSPQWNAWYYVNTKDANPQAIWNHPADNAGAAPGISSGAAPPSAATPSNPDSRPLPEGWISEYSPEHKTFYYVNTKAADPGSTVTWSHPVDAKDGAATGTGTGGGHSATPVPASGAGGKHNPDTRPLPTGWITDCDENYKAWYYVDTNHPEKGSSWQHPSETQRPGPGPSSAAPVTGSILPPAHGQQHSPVPAAPGPSTTSPGPISQGASYTGPPASENPDKRPLPPGWTAKFDENYKTWYYIDTTKPNGPSSWEHPADKTAALGATPSAGGVQKPALNITTPGSTSPSIGGGHASNPDTRPLPAGWITQYDSNRNTWFYVNTTAHPPQTTWEHPAGKLAASPGSPPPIGQQGAAGTTPGKGLEGLLGAKGGKMVGGLLGSKARTQMDGFADLLGTEYSKFKKTPGGAPPGQAYPGQSQYQAPPGQVPGQAVPPPANPPPPAGGLGGSLGNLSGMAGKFGFGKK